MSDGFTAVTKKKGKKPSSQKYLFVDDARVFRERPPGAGHAAAGPRASVDFGELAGAAEEAGLVEMAEIPDAMRGEGTGNSGARRLRLLVVEGRRARKHRDIWKLRAHVKNFLEVPADLLPQSDAFEDAVAQHIVTHFVVLSSVATRAGKTNNIRVVPTPNRVPEFDDRAAMWAACEAAQPYAESTGGFQLYAVHWFSDQTCHAVPASLAQVEPTHRPAVIRAYVDVVSDLFAASA